MNPEKFLMLKVLEGDAKSRDAAFKQLSDRGIDISYFMTSPDYWSFVVKHKKQYKSFPSRKTFEKQFGVKEQIDVPEPLAFYMDEIAQHKRYRIVASAMDKADEFFAADKIDDGIAYLRSEVKKVDSTFVTKDMNIAKTVEQRIERYQYRIDNPGVDGIPSGLPRLDQATYGWHGGEFNIIQAYLGSYKTWTLLHMAKAAMEAGYRPLIATVEMGQFQVARRLDSILAKTAFEKIRSGQFQDDKEIEAFKQRMDLIKGMPECIIIGGVSFGELFLQAKIEEYEPDIVFIDGIYLMVDDDPNSRKAQWEQLNHISRGLKITAENYQVPVIATTQAWKKSAKPGSKGDESVDDIAYSGGMAQNADNIVSLGRIYDYIAEAYTNRIWVKLTKLREGEPIKFQATLDFNSMTLRESIGVSDERSASAYELSGDEDESLTEGKDYNVGIDKAVIDEDEEIPF